MLSTRRLDQVLEHEAGDLTCIVEAGVRVRDLNARLAEHGQMLALDPPGNPTIGACLAANLSGPRRHRYGTARDLVIGVTVVLADGTVASSGGKVVKNVAGYDLGKLFCGSRGAARPDRARRAAPAPAAGGVRGRSASRAVGDRGRGGRRGMLRAPLELSALDVVWPGRVAVLFEGSRARGRRAVRGRARARRGRRGFRLDLGGGGGAAELGRRAGCCSRPASWRSTLAGLDEAVVRVSAGVAYVREPVPDPRDPVELALVERVRAELDPAGVLA